METNDIYGFLSMPDLYLEYKIQSATKATLLLRGYDLKSRSTPEERMSISTVELAAILFLAIAGEEATQEVTDAMYAITEPLVKNFPLTLRPIP